MKKIKHLFLALLLFCSAGVMARQSLCTYQPLAFTATPVTYLASNDETQQIINKIIDVVGLKPNFEVRAANVPNAAAVTMYGKRYVLYNPNFISALNKAAGNHWASVSVLAHEIGHHLNGHTLSATGSQPDKELEADEFSGFVLCRMGASLNDAQIAMRVAADARGSATHPAQYNRLTAIAAGWNNADAQLSGRKDVAVHPPVTRPPSAILRIPIRIQ